jgi:nitrate reductase gamma subunit
VETWIWFGRGPLFRIAFALLVLGLVRLVVLTLVELGAAYRRSADRMVNWREVRSQTLGWLIPLGRLWRQRPVYSTASALFHAGLLVPVFLAAHVLLWKRVLPFPWPALPQTLANRLTLLAIAAALLLFLGRVCYSHTRRLSRPQDFVWPLLLATPFVTGYLCANVPIGTQGYQAAMLIHVYAADLIMVLIPFTKIAHCVLAPFSQAVTAVAWKFPAGAGDRVAETLGRPDQPSWPPNVRPESRSGIAAGKQEAAR